MALPSPREWFDRQRLLRAQFRQVFDSPSGEAVLKELARLAKLYEAEPPATEREMWMNLGERRLFLRIVKFMRLTDEQLDALAPDREE